MSDAARFWDKRAKGYDRVVSRHDRAYDEAIASVRALLRPEHRVLDLGCASGEKAADLAPHVRELVGVDVSAKMVALAEAKVVERGIGNARFLVGGVGDVDLEPGSFDVVVCFFVLHLVEDLDATLRRIHGLLAPGGVLVAQTPLLLEAGPFVRPLLGWLARLRIVPGLTPLSGSELRAALERAGFEVVEDRQRGIARFIRWMEARRR